MIRTLLQAVKRAPAAMRFGAVVVTGTVTLTVVAIVEPINDVFAFLLSSIWTISWLVVAPILGLVLLLGLAILFVGGLLTNAGIIGSNDDEGYESETLASGEAAHRAIRDAQQDDFF